MKTESYNQEILHATAMFMDVFNDITIRRQSGKKIKVKLLNGKRSRIFKALENPGRTPIEPPIIAVSRTGVTRDADRVADLNSHLLRTTGSSIDYDFYAPNPVDLSFELSILTKKQSDMDRIISNFIPFCNKSFFVKTPHPKIKSQVIKHEVIWDGEINEEDKSEIADTENELFLSTTTFTFKTWIWAGTQKELEEQAIIKKINVFPNLFSLGTLELLSQATNENSTVNFSTLSSDRFLELDTTKYYDDIFSLSHWYAVDTGKSFDEYEKLILSGKVSPYFYDNLPISGVQTDYTSADYKTLTSGYVKDLNLNLDIGNKMKVNGEDVYYVDNRGGILVYSTVSGKLSNTGKAIQDEGFILSAGIQEANTTTISVTGLQVGTGSQPITATGPFALPQVKLDRDASNIRRTFCNDQVEATVRRPYFNITNILSGNTDANGLYFRTSATTNPTYVKENDNKTKIKFDTTDSRWELLDEELTLNTDEFEQKNTYIQQFNMGGNIVQVSPRFWHIKNKNGKNTHFGPPDPTVFDLTRTDYTSAIPVGSITKIKVNGQEVPLTIDSAKIGQGAGPQAFLAYLGEADSGNYTNQFIPINSQNADNMTAYASANGLGTFAPGTSLSATLFIKIDESKNNNLGGLKFRGTGPLDSTVVIEIPEREQVIAINGASSSTLMPTANWTFINSTTSGANSGTSFKQVDQKVTMNLNGIGKWSEDEQEDYFPTWRSEITRHRKGDGTLSLSGYYHLYHYASVWYTDFFEGDVTRVFNPENNFLSYPAGELTAYDNVFYFNDANLVPDVTQLLGTGGTYPNIPISGAYTGKLTTVTNVL